MAGERGIKMGQSIVPWSTYLHTIEGIKGFCKEQKQDWVWCLSGMEGAGKSTLAAHTALALQEDFDIRTQIVDNLTEYIALTRKMRNKPGSVIFWDEAVKSFFSREYGNRANIILVKLLISSRSWGQQNLLTMPSFFYLDKYIREWRLKTMTYSWIDWEVKDHRYFALYHRQNYKNLLLNQKARVLMLDRERLISEVKPNFISIFKPLTGQAWAEYSAVKERNQVKLLEEAEQEATALEDARKIGFNRNTPPVQFMRWLISHFGIEDPVNKRWYVRGTYEAMAKEAVTNKQAITDLMNKLLDKELLASIGKTEYIITSKGTEQMKAEDAHIEE